MRWDYNKQSFNNFNVQVVPLWLESWTSQWHHPIRGVRAHVLTIQVDHLSKVPFFLHPIDAVCQWEWTCPWLFITMWILWIAIRSCPMLTHICTTSVDRCRDISKLTHQPCSQDQSCSCSVCHTINDFSIIAYTPNRDSNQVSRPLLTRLRNTGHRGWLVQEIVWIFWNWCILGQLADPFFVKTAHNMRPQIQE